ncbi:type IV pilus biogenesis protein PilM [Vibrio metoecus]|nr:type IV pilus biogenesis protein PilM [Vibrio metoecus]
MGKSLVTGIDIGHHSIKAVVLKPMGDTYALMGYEELLVTADIFTDNHTLDYQKIVKKLKELKKGLPLFSQKVAIAIPDNAVISKVLQIDSDLELREQEFAIYQAFSHQSPFPVEDLSLDFVKVAEKILHAVVRRRFKSMPPRKKWLKAACKPVGKQVLSRS